MIAPERVQAAAEAIAAEVMKKCDQHGPIAPRYAAEIIAGMLQWWVSSAPANGAPTAVDLAYFGRAMRRAQTAYFEARKRRAADQCQKEFYAARKAEKEFDAAVSAVLATQQQTIPGMEGGAKPI